MSKRWFVLSLISLSAAAHDPEAKQRSNYVFKLNELEHIEAAPGESIELLRGDKHGFDSLSFVLTTTLPCGGPPVHVHKTEEAHVLYEGCAEYLIGSERFTVHGPYVARVPAGVPHTFMNCGKDPLHLTAVFPTSHYSFEFVKPSPLCEQSKLHHK
jgi:mannose-6-phosphate isomerase-like protein (cupin superfamily)